MELSKFYAAQQELDAFVSENLGINIHTVENVDKRVFALKVELSEFANETGWFKYWKQSHKMDRESALEEHADVTHFFLSVGLSRNYNKFIPTLDPRQWYKVPLEHLFRYIMESEIGSSGQWKNNFEQHIQIGLRLGFTIKEMELAYFLKRQKNFERQINKY
jgi:dimeric dUTPase (all-alpha-NTP-PPase superfamily)